MKTSQHGARRGRGLLIGLFAFSIALLLLVITSVSVLADNVTIVDNAHVLDVAQVTGQASQLPNPVTIYTNKTFTGSNTDFDTFTTTFIGPNDSNLIVINIDTVHRHLAIVGGTQVQLTNDQYAAAIQAFKDSFNNGDYTGATIAALQSLNNALTSPSNTNSTYPGGPGSYSGGPGSYTGNSGDPGQVPTFANSGFDLFSIVPVCSGFVVIMFVVIIVVFVARAASGRSRPSSFSRNTLPRDATPWEAGALGTGIGGMAGYELGREEMERQNRERIQQQMFNNNNNDSFGGGNIGGGAGGDFGGGNMGGGGMDGGNIGGGSSGNF